MSVLILLKLINIIKFNAKLHLLRFGSESSYSSERVHMLSLGFLVVCTVGFIACGDSGWNNGDTRVVKQGEVLSDYHGVVQVYFEVDGWYTACVGGPDDKTASSVACRQMNYIGAVNYTGDSSFQPSSANIQYLSNINCDSVDEGNLLRCGYTTPTEKCTPLSVFCNNTPILDDAYDGQIHINKTGIAQSKGILMMSVGKQSLPVCNPDSLNMEKASSACRQLGYTTATDTATVSRPGTNCWELEPIVYGNGNCVDRSQPCFTNCFKDPKESAQDLTITIECKYDTESHESAGNEKLCAINVRKHNHSSQSGYIGLLSASIVIVAVIVLVLVVLIIVYMKNRLKRRRGYIQLNEREAFDNGDVRVVCAPSAEN